MSQADRIDHIKQGMRVARGGLWKPYEGTWMTESDIAEHIAWKHLERSREPR